MAISTSPASTFDSREVGPGDLFIALKGEATDGHRFVDQAFAAGAAGALVSRGGRAARTSASPTPIAGAERSRAGRRGRAAGRRIVGVTGSVGKTGTKEALFAALDRCAPGRAHRSVKSYNNHTGVPLSLVRMPRAARFGVFEMGMNHAGELAALDPAGAPARRHRHHDRAGASRIFRQRRRDRRRQGRDFRGAGAGRHRDHPLSTARIATG